MIFFTLYSFFLNFVNSTPGVSPLYKASNRQNVVPQRYLVRLDDDETISSVLKEIKEQKVIMPKTVESVSFF